MPVDLPPPVVPAVVPAAEIRGAAKSLRYPFGNHVLHLVAFDTLGRRMLDRVVRSAPSAEHVVLELARLAYLDGHLSAQVLYAVDGRDVYIMLVQRPVHELRSAPQLENFFAGAIEHGRLNPGKFERGRVLASAYADRTGMKVQPRFVELPSADAMDLELRAIPDRKASSVLAQVEVNNHGARFAGRNLLAVGVTVNPGGGLQAFLQGKATPSSLNREEALGDYREYEVHLNRVHPGGITGITGRRIQFSTGQEEDRIGGLYQEYGLEWSDVLAASFDSRLMLRLRGAYSDRQTEAGLGRETVFLEQYALAEAAPTYAAAFGIGRVDASLGIVGGWLLAQNQSIAAEQFQLFRPMLRLRWQQNAAAALTLTGAGQWATDVVPEAQQWTLGGAGSLTAYVPAAMVGDGGSLARLAQSVRIDGGHGWSASAELFGEYGIAQRDAAEKQTAADAGLTLSLAWRRAAEVAVSAARPVGTQRLGDEARADFFATVKLAF